GLGAGQVRGRALQPRQLRPVLPRRMVQEHPRPDRHLGRQPREPPVQRRVRRAPGVPRRRRPRARRRQRGRRVVVVEVEPVVGGGVEQQQQQQQQHCGDPRRTYVETPAYRRLSWALYDNATITRQVFEGTGQAKQYIWVPASQRWQFFWAAPTVQCDAYAVCGAFGVCDQRSQPSCRCPPGFVPASERDWALSDWTGGCRRNSSLACARNGNGSSSTSTDGFLVLPNVKLPDDSLAVGAQSKTECESACLDNCSCQAYTFSGGGLCAVWHGEFRNLQQLYADSGASGSSDLYLRLSESGLRDLSRANKKSDGGLPLQLVVGIVLACVAAALIASALLAWFLLSRRRRRRRLDSMANEAGSSLAVYSYGDLRAATKNFSNRLGGGGFGSVYRGVLKSGDTVTEVAVKKLEGLRQGDKQFRTEVNTLGRIQHVNLVRLLGFCSSADEKLLVYEYMPNGSLEGYLFKGSG
uniref:non-specific serine/threonine protein kinase n=1 Tax=Aegilops tauschii subsp. strangulata TaxID=200361 RepID=A0A453NKT3_AEGTS